MFDSSRINSVNNNNVNYMKKTTSIVNNGFMPALQSQSNNNVSSSSKGVGFLTKSFNMKSLFVSMPKALAFLFLMATLFVANTAKAQIIAETFENTSEWFASSPSGGSTVYTSTTSTAGAFNVASGSSTVSFSFYNSLGVTATSNYVYVTGNSGQSSYGVNAFQNSISSYLANSTQSISTYSGAANASTATVTTNFGLNNGVWLYSLATVITHAGSGLSKHSANLGVALNNGGYLITPIVNGGIASVSFWNSETSSPTGSVMVGINTNVTNNNGWVVMATGTATKSTQTYTYTGYNGSSTTKYSNGGGGVTISGPGLVASAAFGNSTMTYTPGALTTLTQYPTTGISTAYISSAPGMVGIFNNSGNLLYIDDIVITPACTVYYNKASTDPTVTTNWTTNTDGSTTGGATSPSNFTANNQLFYLKNASPTIGGSVTSWTVSGTNSRIALGDGINPITLALPSTFYTGTNGPTSTGGLSGIIDVQTNAVLNIQNGNNSGLTIGWAYPGGFGTGSPTSVGSIIEYNSASVNQTAVAGTYSNLVINNTASSGTVTLGGNVTVNTALVLTKGTLAVGANTLTLPGVVGVPASSGGQIDASNASATVVYNGGFALTPYYWATGIVYQTIAASTFVNNVNNLTINNSAGVVLSQAITVAGTLNLQSGSFVNSTNLTLGNSASITVNAGSLTAAPSFGTAVNLTYNGTTAATTGVEVPSSTSVLNNLTINNSAGVTLGGNATVNGTLTLTSGTFTVGANTLGLNGAAIAGTPANLSAGSTSSISIGGSTSGVNIPSSVSALNNLTVNNSNGTTLQHALTLSGTLTLTSGNLTLSSYNLTLPQGTAVAGTLSTSNHIVTNSSGAVVVAYGSGTSLAYTFPVGADATHYEPVTITKTGSGTQTYNVTIASISGYPSAANSLNYAWDINTNSGTVASTYAFSWVTGDAGSSLAASATAGVVLQAGTNNSSGTTGWPANLYTGGSTPGATPEVTTVSPTSLSNSFYTIEALSSLGVSPTSLSFATTNVGSASTSQTFSLTGALLNTSLSPIVVSAPSNYQVSSDGVSWASSINVTVSSATLSATTVYVEFVPSTSGSLPGSITFSGGGASVLPTVSLTGTGASIYYNNPSTDVTSSANIATNWSTNTSGTGGSHPSNFTASNQIFVVRNAGATMSGAWTVSGTGSSILIGDGSTSVSFTQNQAITGTVTVQNNATLVQSAAITTSVSSGGTVQIASTTYPTLTLASGSTVAYTGTSQTVQAINYSNLDISGATTPIIASSGTVGIAGTFTTGSNITPTVTGSTIDFNGTSVQTIPAFTFNNLSIDNTNATATSIAGSNNTVTVGGTIAANQNFTITAADTLNFGSGATFTSASGKTVYVYGTFNDKVLNSSSFSAGSGSMYIESGGYFELSNYSSGGGSAYAFTNVSQGSAPSGANFWVNCSSSGGPRIPASWNGNIIWQGGTNSIGTGSSTTSSIGGNFTIVSGAINNGSGGSGRTITVGGYLDVQGGEYDVAATGNTATQVLTVSGNVIVEGGNLYATGATGGTGAINIGGNLYHKSGSFGNNATGTSTLGTITFDGTANQTISSISGGYSNNPVVVIANTAGSGLVSLDSSVSGIGNLTLTSGTLTVGAHTLSLDGSITRTANGIDASNGSATVVMAGSAAQTIPASTFTGNVNNLTINNSNGVSLSQSITLANTLTLTSGNLSLGTSNLTLTAANAVAGTPSTSKHIVASGTGYVQCAYTSTGGPASNGAYTFPVGFDATDYNPVTITNTSVSSATYTVRSVATSSVASLVNSLKASWIFTGITSTTSVSIPWSSSTDVATAGEAPTTNGELYYYSSSWNAQGGSTAAGTPPAYTTSYSFASAPSSSYYWTVSEPCVAAGTPSPSAAASCLSNSTSMSGSTTGTNLTYQWLSSSTSGGTYTNVADNTPSGVTYSSSGTSATLNIVVGSGATGGSNYYYKCAATAACNSSTPATSSAATLTINPTVSIGTSPSDATATISGATGTMSVSSVVGSSLTYQWKYSTTTGGTYTNVSDGTPTGVTYGGTNNSSSLTITAGVTATAGAAGYYECFVSGDCGTATSGHAGLTIQSAALLNPPTLSAAAGQKADQDFVITFTDDGTWSDGGNISGITVDGIPYTSSSYTVVTHTAPTLSSLTLSHTAITQLNTAGSHTIVVSASLYNDASVTQTNVAGTATQLVMHTEPSSTVSAGGAFGTQPAVYVEDTYGNIVTADASTVSATVGIGTGPLTGTLTATVSSGVAIFSGLDAPTLVQSGLKLTFTDGSLTSAVDATSITVSASTAAKLAMKTEPSASVTAGGTFGTQPAVYVEDTYGNVVTSNSSTVTATVGTGIGPFTGTLTATASSGVATFSGLDAPTLAQTGLKLTFTDGALTSVADATSITVNAGSATKLAITTIASQQISAAFNVVVNSTDAYGNASNATANYSIALTQASGTGGNLSGTLTGTLTSGTSTATISGVLYNKIESTSITATATGTPSLTAATSNTFSVTGVTYYSQTSGTMNWTDSKWGTSSGGPFNLAVGTSGNDNVVIQSGCTVNLNTNYTTSSTGGTITVTGTLNITSGYKLTAGNTLTVSATTGHLNIANGASSIATNPGSSNGILVIGSTSTFTLNGSMDVSGYFRDSVATTSFVNGGAITFENYSVCELYNGSITAAPTATWASNSNLLITNVGGTNSLLTINTHYGNINFNDPTASTGIVLVGAASAATTGTLYIDGNFTVTNTNGTSGKCKVISGNTGDNITLRIGGDFTIPASSAGQLQFANSGNYTALNIQIVGSLSAGTGWIGSGSATTTIDFQGASTSTSKTINTAYTFNGFTTITVSGTDSLAAAFSPSSSAGSFNVTGTLKCAGFALTGKSTATFTLASGATLETQSATGLTGAIAGYNTANKTFNAGANYIFDGTVAQTTGALLTAANNITINNTLSSGDAVTLSASTNITGALTLSSGTFATGAFALTISGTIAYASGGIDASNASGTLIFAKSGTTTLSSGIIAANINNLTINSGVILNTVAALNVNSALVNNGSVTGFGTINLPQQSSIAQTIAGTGTLVNLTLNNSHGASVSSGNQSISGILTVTSGALNTGTNGLTLKSTSITNSAIVANVGGTITGTATVERYIPAGYRAYRDMAPQVHGAGTIFKNWQENGSSPAGYGIFITGPIAYPGTANAGTTDANGFDKAGAVGANLTTQDLNYTGTWNAFAHTNTTGVDTLDAFRGYRLLIRGDRTANLYTTNIINTQKGEQMYNATTLRATGSLVYGTVTYNTHANGGTINTAVGNSANDTLSSASFGFSLVANPYVCPVDWDLVYGGSSNINASYWYLNPTANATGSYQAYNALSGSNIYSDEPNAGEYIQAGQAVFVENQSSTSPIVVFSEATKAAGSTKLAVFGATAQLSKIYVSLNKQANGSTTYGLADGTAVAFAAGFTNDTYGPQDALKFSGASDNIYIADKGKSLSIDGRLPATASDAIALKIGKPTATTYQLQVDASRYINNGFAPLLYDAYKNTTTALGSGVTAVNFTVDANTAASYANRFSIIFNPSALAINSIVASATLNNKIATITWNTVGEKGESYFEVEKSTDCKTFASISQQTAKNTSTASYIATDNSVVEGDNYYRIKAVSETGSINYSNVAKLTYNLSLTTYNLYPNPLTGKTLNVSLTNVASGKYVVSIYNVLGEKVAEQAIVHEGGSATHAITINNTLARGIYSVTIREEGSNQIVHQTSLSVQP